MENGLKLFVPQALVKKFGMEPIMSATAQQTIVRPIKVFVAPNCVGEAAKLIGVIA